MGAPMTSVGPLPLSPSTAADPTQVVGACARAPSSTLRIRPWCDRVCDKHVHITPDRVGINEILRIRLIGVLLGAVSRW